MRLVIALLSVMVLACGCGSTGISLPRAIPAGGREYVPVEGADYAWEFRADLDLTGLDLPFELFGKDVVIDEQVPVILLLNAREKPPGD